MQRRSILDAPKTVLPRILDDQKEYVDHQLGDDIAEAAERKMADIIGQPVFLYGFPRELKALSMQRINGPAGEGPNGMVYTKSCDLLVPGVGEVVGTYHIRTSIIILTRFRCINEDL